MNSPPVAAPRRFPGRLFLALGLGCTAVGVIGYVVQLVVMHRLTTPWYLPPSGMLGVVFLAASLWQTRTVWRWLALLLVVLIAGGEWRLLLGHPLPPYAGPIEEGRPFPAFATTRADGTPFTQKDLQGDRNTAFVFFRGRW